MAPSGGKSQFTRRGSKGALVLSERLAADTAPETLDLARRAADPKVAELHVRLKGVEHIDATALQILLALRKGFADTGREFALETDEPKARRALEAAGLLG